MNGGYLMVSKTDPKLYDKLQLGLKAGKPILWYESALICFYIDTISGGEITSEIVDDEEVITYGDIILTKGGKTITVSYDGTDATVTEEGSIANPVMENIKDKNGNLRFIEGNGTVNTISGVTVNYNKWSLSGSHLMFVLACNVADTTNISGLTAEYTLPDYIYDKIYPVLSNDVIEYKNLNIWANDGSDSQSCGFMLQKIANNKIKVYLYGGLTTMTKNRAFRIQFDLLIDADYSE